MDAKLQNILQKVQKLLSLANGRNVDDNESKAARAAADKLIQEHRISQAVLETSGQITAEPFVDQVVSEGGRRTIWREILLSGITNHYGCAYYYYSVRFNGKGVQKYTVVGKTSDVDIVSYMFKQLESEIANRSSIVNKGMGLKYASGWLQGCAEGVRQQFKELTKQAQEANASSAMVLLTNRAKEAQQYMYSLPNMSKGKAVVLSSDYSGYNDGMVEGRSMKIKQGLPTNSPNKLT